MPTPKELDMLGRSLSGDWESRVEFFKKFIWGSPRVRRLGAAYSNLDDFLHDCMTNAMRTGKSFNPEGNLGDWVVSVAAWTALERQRMRVDAAAAVPHRIRLCAGVEGDEAEKAAIGTSYVPPRSGAEDSLASRIAAVAGKQQFLLLSKRGVENRTWEETATAAGQSLNTIGPIVARTVDRLARFFGSPPPLNDDLEPVFSWIIREDATARHSKPQKGTGRVIAMQMDPSFYAVTPEMRKIGLSVPAEVRTVVLWDAARSSVPPAEALREHLAKCHYCADLLRALLLMQQALQSDDNSEFLLCPGGFTLLNTAEPTNESFDRHLAECPLCRGERAGALGDGELEKTPKTRTGSGRKMAWAAVAVVLVGAAGYFAQRQYFGAKGQEISQTSQQAVSEKPAPVIEINLRYRDLTQPVDIRDLRWLNSVLPENRQNIALGLNRLQSGNVVDAKFAISGSLNNDPGAQLLYAFILARESPSEGYAAMLKAEAIPPRNPFRCWAVLQAALSVGDKKTIEQEVQHLSSDPEYGARAKDILAKVRARG